MINQNVPWELKGQAEVALLCAPFVYPPQTSIALSLFKSRLTSSGISSKVIYPVFYMAHLLGRDLCERIIRFPENLGIMEFCFTHLTDVGNPYTVEDYVTGMIMDGFEETRQEIRELVTPGREAAEICVEETAKRIIGMGAKVLAGSSIFSQQNATLAELAQMLK